MLKEQGIDVAQAGKPAGEDEMLLKKTSALVVKITKDLEKYRFSDAALSTYDFVWNTLANEYLESTKNREDKATVMSTLLQSFVPCLKLLHPFMPFVTEAIWQAFKHENLVQESLLMTAPWPDK
jgi:valyl-tRNA synthetase